MKTPRTMAAVAVLGLLAPCIPGYTADSAAGQKTFETTCSGCHKLSYALRCASLPGIRGVQRG